MRRLLILILGSILLLAMCIGKTSEKLEFNISKEKIAKEYFGKNELILATTTSFCATGLADALNKKFEEKFGIKVKLICVGTGKALKIASLGDADLVIVHAPKKEMEYYKLKKDAEYVYREVGDFVNRRYIMYNYFIIVGPKEDPAGIRNAKSAVEAFKLIAKAGEEGKTVFISRGDQSGTHLKELSIWKEANIEPKGNWYKSIGKGMGETLITANEMGGYTLSDIGTYLALKDRLKNLDILFSGGKELFNPYHVMVVNPSKHPNVNYEAAMLYVAFITSPEGQRIIYDYGIKFMIDPNTKRVIKGIGKRLFYPVAVGEEVLKEIPEWKP